MRTGKTLLSVGGGDGDPSPASKQGCSKRGSKRVDLLWTFLAEATAVVTFPLANGAKRIVYVHNHHKSRPLANHTGCTGAAVVRLPQSAAATWPQ